MKACIEEINVKDEDAIKKFLKCMNKEDYKLEFKKDCRSFDYISTVLPKMERIIVIGDVHGSDKVFDALKLVKVINDKHEWIGGKTVVVQVGDQIDSCRPHSDMDCSNPETTPDDKPNDVKLLYYFTELHKKAQKHGGMVISLLGNHEIMNAQGDMTYVSRANREEMKGYQDPKTKEVIQDGLDARKHAFKPGNEIAEFLACTRVSCLIIGSNLFVHAGILNDMLKKYDIEAPADLESINVLIRKWLLGQVRIDNVQNLLNSNKVSPFWPRVLGNIPIGVKSKDDDCHKYLNPVLQTLNIGNIIIGHTPQFFAHNSGINSTCESKLWRVDVGFSSSFHPFDKLYKNGSISDTRRIQVLEIRNDNEFNVIKETDYTLS